MRRAAALIVGGGPAGAAAAIGIARAGQRPLVIERQAEIGDALCGGFLSWTTVAQLRRLGVDIHGLGAHRVERLALFTGRGAAAAPLPAPAAALSRRALDSALLRRAVAEGARVETGVSARGIEDGRLRLGDGSVLADARVVLATGKHDLRGAARPRARNPVVGLRWRLAGSHALSARVAGSIELHLFRGGYAGLVMQEDGSANLCLIARDWRFVEAERQPDRLLDALATEIPALGERLGAAAGIGKVQAVANIPYGWRARESSGDILRIGDQSGVIPSLAGEGIAIALASGAMAATAIVQGEPARRFQPRLARRLRRPITLAMLLWRASEHPRLADGLLATINHLPGAAGLAARLTRLA